MMEFQLTMKMDLDAIRELRQSLGPQAEADVHARFLENSLSLIIEELRRAGIHPEVLEEAIGQVRLNEIMVQR